MSMMMMMMMMMMIVTMTIMSISQMCQAAAPRQPVYLQKQVSSPSPLYLYLPPLPFLSLSSESYILTSFSPHLPFILFSFIYIISFSFFSPFFFSPKLSFHSSHSSTCLILKTQTYVSKWEI